MWVVRPRVKTDCGRGRSIAEFFEVGCFSFVVMFYAEDKLPTQDFVECHVQQACFKHCLSNFNSETWLESLQSLHTRCVQGVQRESKNSWAVVSRNYLHFRKKYTSTLVTHREFLIGVCWPVGCFQLCLPWFSKASTAWAAEMLSQLSLPSSEQELKDGPHMLKMDRTVLPETRKRRVTVHMFVLQGKGEERSRGG